MSREVRRVPIGWQHPTEADVYRFGGTQFVPLSDDYPAALANWHREMADIEQRRGSRWDFSCRYHLTGYQDQDRDDPAPITHPVYVGDDPVHPRDEDHLQELLLAQHRRQKPSAEEYMPAFDAAEPLGWCLYETVSDGTPVTPVFASQEALIEHLATVGEARSGGPWRREAAEVLVRRGHSVGSMAVAGGVIYDAGRDADRLDAAMREAR